MRWSQLLARNRQLPVLRALAAVCERIGDAVENADDYDFRTNGEQLVLEKLRDAGVVCVFDVGAHVGDWALMARRLLPDAVIHCFEVVPQTYTILQSRVAGYTGFAANGFGLSDREGTVKLRFFPQVSALSTETDFPHAYQYEGCEGRVITGDAYVRDHDVGRIDFLKIDVEGTEDRVLRGLAGALAERRISIIQFEYGKVAAVTKWLLRDFYATLAGFGFVVGKIYPTYVEFREYEFHHEDFRGANFLAIRHDRSDLVERLRGSTP